MSFQEKSNGKNITKKINDPQIRECPRTSLLINSSFSIANQQKSSNKQVTNEVLKKVSQTIVSLHSTLVPKTQNIEIYRDLSEQQQNMLKLVQDNSLIHTILAGVLAIDSCLKYINRQETYLISSLMKGVTISLGNYRKIEEQFIGLNNGKISQNLLKFYDSIKFVVGDIHKLPAAKIKKNEIEKHNDFISKSKINNQLQISLQRQQNLLYSLLAQQNNSLRTKINELQKELSQLQKQKTDLLKQIRIIDSQKKKLDSENYITETGSQSAKGIHQQILIRQLRDQIMQKNDTIVKMKDQFTIEINQYHKLFKKLEEQNKMLKKYNDVDTVYILQQLGFQVERLRQQKRINQNVMNQIMSQMNNITWNNRNQSDYSSSMYGKDFKGRYDSRYGNQPINSQRFYQIQRSRCPSVSPNNKQQNIINRYFSPNFQMRQKSKNHYKNMKPYERRQSNINRDDSPRFGNLPPEQESYKNIKQRVSRMNIRKQNFGVEGFIGGRRQFKDEIGQMRRSNSKLGNIKLSGILEQGIDMNKLKKEMRRSKFINEQIGYM